MIIWLTGNTGAGKTTTAEFIKRDNCIVLDGDKLRTVWPDVDLSKDGRMENCCRAARLAREIESQGFCVIVSVIAPTEVIRIAIERICNPVWVYVPGGAENTKETPYEIPETLLRVDKV